MNSEQKYYVIPEILGAYIPVNVAAGIMKKDSQFVRQGMIQGVLPIGTVFKKEGSSQYDYYISPRLFWEFTGYVYREESDGKDTK